MTHRGRRSEESRLRRLRRATERVALASAFYDRELDETVCRRWTALDDPGDVLRDNRGRGSLQKMSEVTIRIS